MKVVVQRVKEARCTVNKEVTGEITNGMMLLVGFTEGDDNNTIERMVQKIVNLRIFDDDNGIMNLSVLDVKGSILSISQFTLYADTKKGNRPSYVNAMCGEKASILYDKFNNELRKLIHVETGVFGANMDISLVNQGPVTIILER